MKTLKLLSLAPLALCAGMAQAETIEMQSIYPSSLPLLGATGAELGGRVSRVTGGDLQINFHNPGELVNSNEIWDSVSTGAIQAGWFSPGFAESVIPSASLFTAFPFGPDAVEYTAWWYDGGGKELWAEITADFNIHTELCTVLSPEASGWFNKEINSPEDLQGLKMRIFGLGAAVMEKLGAQAQSLPVADTMSALNLGTIDAAEVSFPAIDQALGMQEHANHYYFPGWHQQSSLIIFIMNQDYWDELSDQHRAVIEEVCAANVAKTTAMGEVIQLKPLAELEEQGVQVHEWSSDMLAAFQKGWDEVVAERSAEDPDFKRVWEHVSAFRDEYKGWRSIGYVK
ncbi:TRAP transporter substrate-binding protein [Oceaniglobus indicus]|uniref:TRAP transporter substrate-binding protein n=1 Tax=Oceaniglobus indicus TaxID=2047749 RepID=UPI001F4EF06B|nr:TRAP transporter substrate-binding protein [Oceaniglobus indicus]